MRTFVMPCLVGVAILAAAVMPTRSADAPRKTVLTSEAIALAKKYLAETDPLRKEAIREQIGDTPANDPAPFLKLIIPAGYDANVKKGVQHGLKLQIPPELGKEPVPYSLWIPNAYKPAKAWPLIVGLHGGGLDEKGQPWGDGENIIGALTRSTEPAIVACPMSMDRTLPFYWRHDKNSAMLECLIREISRKLQIDPDRIYLCGYSMGGKGVYYLGTHNIGRFAGLGPGGGSWKCIHWASFLNTPVYIWHARSDQRGAGYTNFDYALSAEKYLKALGPAYTFQMRAMEGDHTHYSSDESKRMLDWLMKYRRNPYPKRIVTADQRTDGHYKDPMLRPSLPDRWLAVDETGDQQLPIDSVNSEGKPAEHKIKMGVLDASWIAPNVLEVKATNVRKFRVFLSPKLMDLTKPLKIKVNNEVVYDAPAPSSLKFLLRYLDERRDLSMVFVGEVAVNLDPAKQTTP